MGPPLRRRKRCRKQGNAELFCNSAVFNRGEMNSRILPEQGCATSWGDARYFANPNSAASRNVPHATSMVPRLSLPESVISICSIFP